MSLGLIYLTIPKYALYQCAAKEIVMDSLIQLTQKFAAVEACLEHLKSVRWSDGAYCPHCGGSEKIYHLNDGRRHKCGECGRTFRLITGTIFADSPIRLLPNWFAAIWLDTCHTKGISSVQLAKDIGVTQKTAWHMLQRIRHASGNDELDMLGGVSRLTRPALAAKRRTSVPAKGLPGHRGAAPRQRRSPWGSLSAAARHGSLMWILPRPQASCRTFCGMSPWGRR